MQWYDWYFLSEINLVSAQSGMMVIMVVSTMNELFFFGNIC